MGPNYTVGADVGVWGISPGSYPLGLTPWVDKDLMAANKQLFVNTMSYHAPKDCGITPWQKDALDIHHLWGIAKRQINIGIGYYSFNLTGFEKIVGEPTWHVLGEHCLANNEPSPWLRPPSGPGPGPGQFKPNQLPVHVDPLDPARRGFGSLEGRAVDNRLGIEDHQIGEGALADFAAVLDAKHTGRFAGHDRGDRCVGR